MSMDVTEKLPAHRLDSISFGKIVQIREGLLRAQAAGKRVIRFESGDPSFSIAPHVAEAIQVAMRAGKTHYVPNDGIPELRAALAEKLRQKNGIKGAKAEEVFLTNGAMHALYVTFGALLEPGDEVILPDPMWTEVAENVKLAGGTPVGVPVRAEEGYAYRPEAIEAAITPRTRAIFVNTPHNPTGAVMPRETLQAILALARAHDLWIVSDEAYEDVIYEPHVHHSLASLAGDWAPRVDQRLLLLQEPRDERAAHGLSAHRLAAAAASGAEAAALHHQRGEQPGAVGRAGGGDRAAGQPADDAR